LWWSEVFDPEDWPAINYMEVKSGDGDKISCIRKFLGDLVIFKQRSIHSFRAGTNILEGKLDEIDSHIGCVGPKAACALSSRMYFISEQGIYVFNGVAATSLHSERIPRLWGDINKEYLENACAYAWDNLVWFSLPLQNQLTLQVTQGASVAGSITITLGGIDQTVALTVGDNTVGEVATKIGALEFEGWTLSAETDTVTFTRDELNLPLTLTCDAGTTGTTTTIATVDQTTNNLVLVFNPSTASFWPMQGINASAFQTFHDGTELKFYAGDSNDGYINQLDIGTEDFDEPISAYYIPKGFDGGQPEHLKKARKAYIEDAPNQSDPVTLKMARDYAEYKDYAEWTLRHDDGFIREYRAPNNDKWRYLNAKFIHNTAGGFELRSFTVPIKLKRRPKGRERIT
jgi:archaellin